MVRQAQLDAGDRKDGVTSEERQEMARLHKRVKQLETERGIHGSTSPRSESSDIGVRRPGAARAARATP